jgi:hypothetical protein
MGRLTDIVTWQTTAGRQVTVGDITLTPQAQSLIIRWPYGGWVWTRPIAVQAVRNDRPGQQAARLPIIDITRLVQVGLLALSLIFSIITLFLIIQQRRNRNE